MNILMELEEVAKQADAPGAGASAASRIFDDACEALKVYAEYTANQHKSGKLIVKLTNKKGKFHDFCEVSHKFFV